LYAIGRTKPGKKVTKAKGGTSYHNYGLAFDIYPFINGKTYS
jgi:peptidoglycan L-alanyl-D-glutamate endopeptidase CwlK